MKNWCNASIVGVEAADCHYVQCSVYLPTHIGKKVNNSLQNVK